METAGLSIITALLAEQAHKSYKMDQSRDEEDAIDGHWAALPDGGHNGAVHEGAETGSLVTQPQRSLVSGTSHQPHSPLLNLSKLRL
jgi:hypothetical protein